MHLQDQAWIPSDTNAWKAIVDGRIFIYHILFNELEEVYILIFMQFIFLSFAFLDCRSQR